MKNDKQNNEIIFSVTIEELQDEAINRIGRKLSDDELYIAKEGVASGLSFDIGTIFRSAIEGVVEEESKT